MPNIMVNHVCNLRCPYCFAGEFVNRDTDEMSLEDFQTALNFILGDQTMTQIGVIGGEPLLYSRINEAMKIAIADPRSDHVMIYTNAAELGRLSPEILEHVKFRMLVNCNPPEDMGRAQFEKMRENLRKFVRDHGGDGRFRLSVNIYKPDFDYGYVTDVVRELGCNTVRLSISVPVKEQADAEDALSYFRRMKPVALAFIMDMVRCGAITGLDCNFIPPCVFTRDELKRLRDVKSVLKGGLDLRFSASFWDRAIFCEVHNCSPVIDILPDLTAIRCFGLSGYTKQDIRDYKNIGDLAKYYKINADHRQCNVWRSQECADCYKRENGECSGGCYLFKAGKLFAAR